MPCASVCAIIQRQGNRGMNVERFTYVSSACSDTIHSHLLFTEESRGLDNLIACRPSASYTGRRGFECYSPVWRECASGLQSAAIWCRAAGYGFRWRVYRLDDHFAIIMTKAGADGFGMRGNITVATTTYSYPGGLPLLSPHVRLHTSIHSGVVPRFAMASHSGNQASSTSRSLAPPRMKQVDCAQKTIVPHGEELESAPCT